MKFSTTDISLFTGQNKEVIPDWMMEMNTDVKEVKKIDLGIEAKPAFSEKTIVERRTGDATVREVTANFNEAKAKLDSKIELSKFLTGKFFKTEQTVIGNRVVMATKIQNVPADFNFIYEVKNGKMVQAKTFNVDFDSTNHEYPFSKAAFEECLMDIKSNKPKMAKVAENIGQYSIINKEEIVRRYNGKLRAATDKINELIAEGLLVGVGSNSYGSFCDLDQLIPQEEKEKGMEKQSEFEFVNNKEHVEMNPHKDANVLAIESSKFLSEIFQDFNIVNSSRDNNELLVTANVLTKTGMTLKAHFSFDIENEKVNKLKVVEYNNDRLTLDQFTSKIAGNVHLNEYHKNNKIASRIYKGIVLTEKNIKHILSSHISNDNIEKVIGDWVKANKIAPINSTTFITESSLENLLNDIQVQTLSDEEKEQMLLLADKTLMYRTERQDVKDTGVRDQEVVEKTYNDDLTNLKMHLGRRLSNFEISRMKNISDDRAKKYTFDLIYTNPKSGLKMASNMLCKFENNAINVFVKESKIDVAKKIASNVYVEFDKFLGETKVNNVVASYLNGNSVNNGQLIKISKKQLENKLSDFCSKEEIGKTFEGWIKSNMVTVVAENTVLSKYSVEQLLANSNIKQLSAEDMEEIQLAKQHFGRQLTAYETVDTGVRQMEEFVSDDTMLRSCNEYLSKVFNSFKVTGFDIGDQMVNYSVQLFDEESGITCSMNISFSMDGNTVTTAKANINNKEVSLANVKTAFAKSDVLNKYLSKNAGKKFNAPMIITSEKLKQRLKHICSTSEINSVIDSWCKQGKAELIGPNVLASKHTLEQLINDSNLKALSDDEIKNRLNRSMRNKDLKVSASYIQDSDTRQPIELWSPERILLESKAIISKTFNSFEILDANTSDDAYSLKIRALNPKTGTKQLMNCKFKIVNSKISKLESIQSDDSTSIELNSLLENYKPSTTASLGIASRSNLKSILSKVMDVNETDNALDLLASQNMITQVGANNYALKATVAELVDYLANQKVTNIAIAKDQLQDSQRTSGLTIDDKRTMSTPSRQLEAKEKELSENMLKLRDKIQGMVTSAYNGKLLTANKYNSLNTMLKDAKEEKDLEDVSKELKRYLM